MTLPYKWDCASCGPLNEKHVIKLNLSKAYNKDYCLNCMFNFLDEHVETAKPAEVLVDGTKGREAEMIGLD